MAESSGKPDHFAARLASDTKLATRLTPLLPSGMTLATAASGFKNEGQLVDALHVAKIPDIPFLELKDRMTAGESLGAAIHALKPDLIRRRSSRPPSLRMSKPRTIEIEASASSDVRSR